MIKCKGIKFFGLFLVVMVLLTGCFGPFAEEEEGVGGIQGVVKVNDQLISGVKVELVNRNKVKYTGSSGEYKFSDLKEGNYTVQFTNTDPLINEEKTVVVAAGKTANVNLILDFDSTSLQDAKDMVAELKAHGLNLKTTADAQTAQVEENFNTVVAPYMEAVGARLGMIADTLEFWETLLPDDTSPYGPGTYVINSDVDGEPEIVTAPDPVDLSGDTWIWDITDSASSGHLVIEITNLEDIMTKNSTTGEVNIDLTAAEYHYDFDVNGDGTIDWSFDFTLTSSAAETITETDTDETYYVTIPRVMEVTLDGTLDDNLHETGKQFASLEDIGTVTVDGDLSLDLEVNNTISYQGSFDSEELDLNGSATIEFADSDFPSYAQLMNGVDVGLVSITTTSSLATQVVSLDGTTEIEFITPAEVGYPIPDLITFDGTYQDISGTTEGVTLTGSLEVDPVFTNFDFSQEESATNYVPAIVSLSGQLTNTSYDDVNLTVTGERDGYQHATTEFEYEFTGNKFIRGVVVSDTETVLDLAATNQNNLGIVIKSAGYNDPNKIGEITNYSGTEKFADIVIDDTTGEPMVLYTDQTVETLLP